jgi:hypothetical protein
MLTGLTKFTNVYLAPVLLLTSVVLVTLSYLSPVLVLTAKVALLTVTPSISLTEPTNINGDGIDGPSVFIGPLGSCSRPNNAMSVVCEAASASPHYGVCILFHPFCCTISRFIADLTTLPSSSPSFVTAPTATTPVFIGIGLGFAILFFIFFTLTTVRTQLPEKLSAALDKPGVHRATAWIGLLGFMTGFTSFLVMRMWFGKAVEDFNDAVLKGGSDSPALVAQTGNGFVSE